MKKIILFLLVFTAIGIAQTHTFWGTNNGVKVYRALISQSGIESPEAIVLENSIGNIVWTRQYAGIYYGTLNNAFPEDKTFINHHTLWYNSGGGDTYLRIYRVNNNQITFSNSQELELYFFLEGVPLSLEILVYP